MHIYNTEIIDIRSNIKLVFLQQFSVQQENLSGLYKFGRNYT